MLWILLVMGLIVAVMLALIVGGLVTPREHVTTRSRSYHATPEDVWRIVRDVSGYAEWREDMIEVETLRGSGDEPAEQWREITSGGTITFGIVAESRMQMVARVLDDDLSWGGTWAWEVAPVADGARLTITEKGHVSNPVIRFIRTHFTGFGKPLDSYLRALELRLRGHA